MQIGKILKKRSRDNKGFTLIEVIATLVILAIIAAVAIARGTGTEEAKMRAEVDTLKGHLRYAQYLAMNDISPSVASGTRWGISFGSPTTSYKLVKYIGPVLQPDTFSLPGESGATHTFAVPVVSAGTLALILFDEWGSPYNSATSAELTTAATITLNPGGQTITITPETGFIP